MIQFQLFHTITDMPAFPLLTEFSSLGVLPPSCAAFMYESRFCRAWKL